MDFKELDDLAKRIYTGLSIVEYKDRLYFISDPKPKQQLLANKITKDYYNNLLFEGVPTKDTLVTHLRLNGLWTDDLEKELEEIPDKIFTLEKEYNKYEFQRNQKLMIQRGIKELKTRQSYLEGIIRGGTQFAAETLADHHHNKYLLYLCTRDEHDNIIWPSFNEFRTLAQEDLITHLLKHSLYDSRLTEKNIRLVARKDPWRSIWVSAVKTGNLFADSASNMTDFQRILATWSIAYDNVYEHPERPSSEIIEDDELLDKWFAEQVDKQNKAVGGEATIKKLTNNKKIQNAQSVGIVVDSLEEAQRVYGLNEKSAMSTIKMREEALKKAGHLKEGHMPDTKLDLQIRRNNLAIQGTKQRGQQS